MTLTKAELADLLFEKVGLNKREAKDMVEAFFEEIGGGQGPHARGLGKFPAARQPAAPGPQPEDRRGNPDQRAPRRHLPRQPEAESHGREVAPWSQTAGKLIFRRSL